MPQIRSPPLSFALIYFRTCAGWPQDRLGQAVGHSDKSLISAYQRGVKPLTREMLDFLVEALGYSPEAVDVFLFAHGLIHPELPEEVPSRVAPSPEEHRSLDRAVMVAGWTAGRIAAERVRVELERRKQVKTTDAARQEAQELWAHLKANTREDRRDVVTVFPEFWTWALAERVSHESERMAAHRVEDALELANLALSIAERVPGDEGRRSRMKGLLLGSCR